MEAAIDNLHRLPGTKKVAILGDMFELEGEAEREHAHIGEVLREREITAAYLCGALMAAAKKAFPQGKYFATKEELLRELTANPITNATVLVKASRGMALEKVVDAL
jgi:UDP-N-acetylmuramoyl-tripeptide--D-alanyl-D-alanine ligase